MGSVITSTHSRRRRPPDCCTRTLAFQQSKEYCDPRQGEHSSRRSSFHGGQSLPKPLFSLSLLLRHNVDVPQRRCPWRAARTLRCEFVRVFPEDRTGQIRLTLRVDRHHPPGSGPRANGERGELLAVLPLELGWSLFLYSWKLEV